jgi:hypothetical protein
VINFQDFGLSLKQTGEISFASKIQINEFSTYKFQADSKSIYQSLTVKYFENPSIGIDLSHKMNHSGNVHEMGLSFYLESK